MADPLSLVANICAVIGAAEIALRASIEFSGFLIDLKDAPSEIERLRIGLQENTLLLESAKHYLEELKDRVARPVASAELTRLTEALALFTSATRAFQREVVSLATVARKHQGVRKSWGRIKWVLDERKVGRSMHRLEESKSALTIALVFVGRFVGRRTVWLWGSLVLTLNL